MLDVTKNDIILYSVVVACTEWRNCGLATAQGDLWFVVIFGAASVVAIIEAIRRLR